MIEPREYRRFTHYLMIFGNTVSAPDSAKPAAVPCYYGGERVPPNPHATDYLTVSKMYRNNYTWAESLARDRGTTPVGRSTGQPVAKNIRALHAGGRGSADGWARCPPPAGVAGTCRLRTGRQPGRVAVPERVRHEGRIQRVSDDGRARRHPRSERRRLPCEDAIALQRASHRGTLLVVLPLGPVIHPL